MILLRNMKCRNFIVVGFCVLILMIYQAKADKEDKSEETQENQIIQSLPTTRATDGPYTNNPTNTSSSSSEEGPADSHEAMHNRELKPKLTVSSAGGRDKRSYQFLVGLVRNQSGFGMTKAHEDSGGLEDKRQHYDDGEIDMKAAGDLMEMLVKISSHPKEWKSVHDMLVDIDNDLQKSKRILDQIEASPSNSTAGKNSLNEKKSHIKEQKDKQTVGDEYHEDTDHRRTADIKKWPFDLSFASSEPQTHQHNLYRSNNGVADPTKVSYPHNFAYHRVTGKPLYQHHHTSSNSKGPTKAYIAVSVIAPKNAIERDDEINLENELRQLKPWTHQQNLRNMADIRSKWVIQSTSKDNNVDD